MRITQSLVKNLEESCPRKVFDDFEKRPVVRGSPQEKGSYFETLCLGAGAGGTITTSIPLLKSGEKSADQVRIEAQAKRFKEMFPLIVNKQLLLGHDNYEGTIDFVVAPHRVYDLKLTENLDGYWANTAEIDLIQQVFYQWLYEKNYGIKPEMRVIIFEYGPRQRIKELKINVSESATFSALSRFSRIEEQISEWADLDEWPRIPAEKDCSRCPLICDKRVMRDNIIYEEISL